MFDIYTRTIFTRECAHHTIAEADVLKKHYIVAKWKLLGTDQKTVPFTFCFRIHELTIEPSDLHNNFFYY